MTATITKYCRDIQWIKSSTTNGGAEMIKNYLKVTMQDAVKSPELKEKIIPNYEFGVKRPAMSDDYLQAMNCSNFNLVTCGIEKFTNDSIITNTGEEIETDVVIFATGFDCLKSILSFEVIGENGQRLKDMWKNSPKAFKGICVPKMPNFFLM